MDSREPPPPHVLTHHHHHQHQQHHSMLLGPANNNAQYATMINPNIPPPHGNGGGSGGFPFSSSVGPARPQPKPADGLGGGGGGGGGSPFDGSSPETAGMRFSIEQPKKKRGRPRKYTSDGNIALGLSPTPLSSGGGSMGRADSGEGGGTPGVASEPPPKRHRGRPSGSVKKQLDALGGVGGIGFTPHVISVKAGEDIATKIMAFSQQGPRTVCILSANGAICNVTLRQPAMSGGTVTYEGRYEIISLSGSFLLSESTGNRSRTGGLSVSLAGSDGRVLGGGVAGMLTAASPVQIIVGSFIADGKKSSSNMLKSGPSSAPPGQTLNFGAPVTASNSQGASTESSDENGISPLNHGPGIYGNAGQSVQGVHMYNHHLWASQNP